MKTTKRGTLPLLEQLPVEQSEALIRWLNVDNITYATARKRLLAEFGVRTSSGCLSKFYHAMCLPRKWVTDLARRGGTTATGRVLVEIQIRANPDQSLSIAIVGGAVAAHVETISAPSATGSGSGTSTIRVCEKADAAPEEETGVRAN